MAAYGIGSIVFSELCKPVAKTAYCCGKCWAFSCCPCLACCFCNVVLKIDSLFDHEFVNLNGEGFNVLSSETFTIDPFGAMMGDLRRRHKKDKDGLEKKTIDYLKKVKKDDPDKKSKKGEDFYTKYGLDDLESYAEYKLLGMHDPDQVVRKLKQADSLGWSTFWLDLCTGMKWFCPAACNGFCYGCCCCFCDLTRFRDKIATGEAYQVGCCGPFFKDPTELPPVEVKVGRDTELVIIMSCPGDHHAWKHGFTTDEEGFVTFGDSDITDFVPDGEAVRALSPVKEGQGGRRPGAVHTLFQELSNRSNFRPTSVHISGGSGHVVESPEEVQTVTFCPVQTKMYLSEAGVEARAKNKHKQFSDADADVTWRRAQAAADNATQFKLDLWKAYWVSEVKLQIARAKAHMTQLKTIKFVAIAGGTSGSKEEWEQINFMNDLIFREMKMSEVIHEAINSVTCCASCGCYQCGCCNGWKSGLYGTELAINRFLFCAPIKRVDTEFAYVFPGDLYRYLTRQSEVCKTICGSRLPPPDFDASCLCSTMVDNKAEWMDDGVDLNPKKGGFPDLTHLLPSKPKAGEAKQLATTIRNAIIPPPPKEEELNGEKPKGKGKDEKPTRRKPEPKAEKPSDQQLLAAVNTDWKLWKLPASDWDSYVRFEIMKAAATRLGYTNAKENWEEKWTKAQAKPEAFTERFSGIWPPDEPTTPKASSLLGCPCGTSEVVSPTKQTMSKDTPGSRSGNKVSPGPQQQAPQQALVVLPPSPASKSGWTSSA